MNHRFNADLVRDELNCKISELDWMLKDRASILRHEKSAKCEYGSMFRSDVREYIAVIRALRFALAAQEAEVVARSRYDAVLALVEGGEPPPQALIDLVKRQP